MNYKIIGGVLLMSVHIALPMIDTKEKTESKQPPDEKQCAFYCKKILEMMRHHNILEISNPSIQEQEQIIKTMCGKNEEKNINPERMRQWMMYSALLE